MLDVRAAAGTQIVKDDDLVTARYERVGEMRAYESGTAGYEELHRLSPFHG
jgi:hypothetical protein